MTESPSHETDNPPLKDVGAFDASKFLALLLSCDEMAKRLKDLKDTTERVPGHS